LRKLNNNGREVQQMAKKAKLQFTENDKQAIRKNQQALVNFFGTGNIADAYSQIVDCYDYAEIAAISPIFEKLSKAYDEYGNLIDVDLADKIDEINQEIYDFFEELPYLTINLDYDTFYKKYMNDGFYDFDVANSYSFSDFLEELLDSEELTKDEKEKILSIVYKL
jgi:hypothetical protein